MDTDKNGAAPQAPSGPPWLQVPAEALVPHLLNRLQSQNAEMAAMAAYIDQLHQALSQLTGGEDGTHNKGPVGSTKAQKHN